MANKAYKTSITGHVTTIGELIWLNFLTLFCCIPVFTAGASLTAMHAVLLKIVRKEEGYIARDFFDVFRKNFKHATILWIPFLMIFIAAAVDVLAADLDSSLLPKPIVIAAAVAAMISFLIMQFVFPLQSYFENTVTGTINGAMILTTAYFPRTFLMAAVGIMPIILALKLVFILPLSLVIGLTGPGYLSAKLYHPVFVRLEEQTK